MTSTSVAAATPADFDANAPAGQSPDTLSAPGPGGVAIRLPPYSKGGAPITLAQLGTFEIKAQTLFPTIDQQSGFNHPVPRFTIRVVRDSQTVYQQRHSASEVSLLQALTGAINWVKFRRRQEKLEYIGSLPGLLLWTFCMAFGWLFQPIDFIGKFANFTCH